MNRSRIALVTGGTGGLGTAICKSLADIGYRVIANYHPDFGEQAHNWQEERQGEGYAYDIVAGDVSSLDSSRAMLDDLDSAGMPIDCLVNNAGITRDATLRKMIPEHWEAVINTNLNSLYNVTQPLVEGMMSRGFGRIINISSLTGQTGNYGQTNYAAAKAGVQGFTMALAREVAASGVTVNSISPGFIGTEMVMAMPEEVREKVTSMIPAGRLGKPEEIGRTVAFLAHEDAGYITGADHSVNGGLWMG